MTVVIWGIALPVSLGFLLLIPDADGFEGASWAARALALGTLLLAYLANQISNWIFADSE